MSLLLLFNQAGAPTPSPTTVSWVCTSAGVWVPATPWVCTSPGVWVLASEVHIVPRWTDTANLDIELRSDDIDGSGNTTLVDGNDFSSWKNLGLAGGTFDQPNALYRPTYQAATGPGAKPGVLFGALDRLVSSLPASAFRYLHDGSGCSVYIVTKNIADEVKVFLSTSPTANVTDRGMSQQKSTGYATAYAMSDGTSFRIISGSTGGKLTANKFDILHHTLDAADSPHFSQYVNGVLAAQNNASAFSAGDPVMPLTLGTHRSGQPFASVGPYALVLCFRGSHDATMRAATLADIAKWANNVIFPA